MLTHFNSCIDAIKIHCSELYSVEESVGVTTFLFDTTLENFKLFYREFWIDFNQNNPRQTTFEFNNTNSEGDERFHPSDMAEDVFEDDLEYISVSFKVLKHRYITDSNLLFFYDLDCFNLFLSTDEFHKFINTNIEKQKFIFIPISENKNNGYLNICPIQSLEIDNQDSYSQKTDERLFDKIADTTELYSKYNSLSKDDKSINPYLIHLNENIDNESLRNSLNHLQYKSISYYLSNKYSEINNHFLFKSKIDITINLDEFVPMNISIYFNLFELIYVEEKFNDKIELFKNTLVYYFKDNGNFSKFDELLPKIFKSYERNFQNYISKKIETFFDKRKDVEKEAYNAALQAKTEIDKIVTSINTLLLSVVTASLIGLVTYTRDNMKIFIISIGLHILYIFTVCLINSIHYRYSSEKIVEQFKKYIVHFSILDEIEVKEIENNTLTPTIDRHKNLLKIYKIIAVILILLLGYLAFSLLNNDNQLIIDVNNYLNSRLEYLKK